MIQAISNFIRGIAHDAVGHARRIAQDHLRVAFLIEESNQITELREQANHLEQTGHLDLANALRKQADGMTVILSEFSDKEPASQGDAPLDVKAQIVMASNVLPCIQDDSSSTLLKKRGRPRKSEES